MCLDKDGLVNDTVGAYGKRVDGYYGLGQWMYRLVNGELEYPVEAVPDDAPLKERKEYQEKIAEWESLSMDRIPVYGFDTAAAKALLVKDGWTLNADGGKYTEGVRYAKIGKQLVPLRFTILCPEGSSITEHLQERFVDHLAEIGIEAVIETAPMPELLRSFYRDEERAADMYVLASNFDLVFDPSITFMSDGKDAVNRWNPTGIADRLLYKYAVEMRETEPGNLLDYCKKWIKFQKRFQEICPMIPIYSNVYYDVYANDLQDYDIFSNVTWSQAIVPAWLGSGQEN